MADDGDNVSPRGDSSVDTDSSISESSAFLNVPPSIERGGFFPTSTSSTFDASSANGDKNTEKMERLQSKSVPYDTSPDYFSSPSVSSADTCSTASRLGDGDDSTANAANVIPETITRSGPPIALDTVFEVDGFVTDGESTAAGTSTTPKTSGTASEHKDTGTFIPGSIATDFNQHSPSAFSDFDATSPSAATAADAGAADKVEMDAEGVDDAFSFDNKQDGLDNSTVATPDSAIALLHSMSGPTSKDQTESRTGTHSPGGHSVRSTPSRSPSPSTSSNTNTLSTSPEGSDMWPPAKSPRNLLLGQFDVPEAFEPIIRTSSHSTFVYIVANDHWSSPASRVILKLMNDPKQVTAELEGRKGIDEKFILACRGVFIDSAATELNYEGPVRLERHENLETEMKAMVESRVKRTTKAPDVQVDIQFPYILAFERYDCTLKDVLDHSYLDLSIVRSIAKDIVVGLILLHTEKRIHSNINPASIVRVKKSWKLADLHSNSIVGTDLDLKGIHQSCLPPEAAASILNSENNSPKCVADTSFDLFSLGCILYHLVFGKPLWNVNNIGTISRAEMKKLAQWSPRTILEHVSTRFLTNRRSDEQVAVLDLLNKLLARTKEERSENFEVGFVSVHQHEFLSKKSLEVDSITAFTAKNDAVLRDGENFRQYQDIVNALTVEERWELTRAKDVLLLGMFEPVAAQIPTSIVVLRHKLPTTKPEEMTKREAQKRLAEGIKWIDVFDNLMLSVRGALEGDVSSIGHFWIEITGFFRGDNMYMYFIDELTGEPVVPPESGSTSYPIEIATRSDILPTILPMVHLTMRSMALYHGVAGIARMYGCSLACLPDDMRTSAQEKINALKKERNLYPFGSIADDVIAIKENKEHFMRSESLRAKSSIALAKLLGKKLGHEALATGSFVGLRRYPDEAGRAVYTLLGDAAAVKEAIQIRAEERLKEEKNLWLDRSREEISALESALRLEKEGNDQLKARIVEIEKEIQRRNAAQNFLEGNLAQTQRSLDDSQTEIARVKQELEIERQKPKCGSDACIVQ